jgi:hypothetical protein
MRHFHALIRVKMKWHISESAPEGDPKEAGYGP